MAALLFNVSRLTFRKKLYQQKLMYKTVKTQTNLPVKICHLKAILSTIIFGGFGVPYFDRSMHAHIIIL